MDYVKTVKNFIEEQLKEGRTHMLAVRDLLRDTVPLIELSTRAANAGIATSDGGYNVSEGAMLLGREILKDLKCYRVVDDWIYDREPPKPLGPDKNNILKWIAGSSKESPKSVKELCQLFMEWKSKRSPSQCKTAHDSLVRHSGYTDAKNSDNIVQSGARRLFRNNMMAMKRNRLLEVSGDAIWLPARRPPVYHDSVAQKRSAANRRYRERQRSAFPRKYNYPGVVYHQFNKGWEARLRGEDGKKAASAGLSRWLGYHPTEELAIKAVEDAKKRLEVLLTNSLRSA